jgi:hypothetical protein
MLITSNGRTVAQGETSNPYGEVSVAANVEWCLGFRQESIEAELGKPHRASLSPQEGELWPSFSLFSLSV